MAATAAPKKSRFQLPNGFKSTETSCAESCGVSVKEFVNTANRVMGRVNTYVKAYCKLTDTLTQQMKQLQQQLATTTSKSEKIMIQRNIALKEAKIKARTNICDMLDQQWTACVKEFDTLTNDLKTHSKKKDKLSPSDLKKAELTLKRRIAVVLNSLAHLTPRADDTEAEAILSLNATKVDGSKWSAEEADAVRLNAVNMAANCGSDGSSVNVCPVEGGEMEMDECTYDAAVKACRKSGKSDEIPQVFKDYNTDTILKKKHDKFMLKLIGKDIKTFPDIIDYATNNANSEPLFFPTFMAAAKTVFDHLPDIMEKTCECCLDTEQFKKTYDKNTRKSDAAFRALFNEERMHQYLGMVEAYLLELRYRMGAQKLKVLQQEDLLWTFASSAPTNHCKKPYIRKLNVPSCASDRIKNLLAQKAAAEACNANKKCATAIGLPAAMAALVPAKFNSVDETGSGSGACGTQKFAKRRVYHDPKYNISGVKTSFQTNCVGGKCDSRVVKY